MPNLGSTSSVGRDNGDRSYVARGVGRNGPNQYRQTQWDPRRGEKLSSEGAVT